MSLTGLDISRYQTTTPALANYSFVFIRATYGLAVDAMYAAHMTAARGAKIVAGSYHFGYGSGVATPEAQARMYLTVAANSDLLALDLESSADPMSLAEARRFISAVHDAGRQIGLYHSESGFPECGQDWDWIASWDRDTFPPGAAFWQYRGSPLDLDKFNGDAAALRALVAMSHGADPMTDIDIVSDPKLVDLPSGIAILNPDGSARHTNTTLRTGVVSPGTTVSAGGTVMRLVVWTRPDPTPDILLAAYNGAVKNIRPANPVVNCDDVVTIELGKAAVRAADAVRAR